jgi:hypothetical protein
LFDCAIDRRERTLPDRFISLVEFVLFGGGDARILFYLYDVEVIIIFFPHPFSKVLGVFLKKPNEKYAQRKCCARVEDKINCEPGRGTG